MTFGWVMQQSDRYTQSGISLKISKIVYEHYYRDSDKYTIMPLIMQAQILAVELETVLTRRNVHVSVRCVYTRMVGKFRGVLIFVFFFLWLIQQSQKLILSDHSHARAIRILHWGCG